MHRPARAPRSRDARARRRRGAGPEPAAHRPDAGRGGALGSLVGPAGRGPHAATRRHPARRPGRGLGHRPVRPPGRRGERGHRPRGRDARLQRPARAEVSGARGRAGAHPAQALHRAGGPRVPPGQAQGDPVRPRGRRPGRCPPDAPGSAPSGSATTVEPPSPLDSWARLLFGEPGADAGDAAGRRRPQPRGTVATSDRPFRPDPGPMLAGVARAARRRSAPGRRPGEGGPASR